MWWCGLEATIALHGSSNVVAVCAYVNALSWVLIDESTSSIRACWTRRTSGRSCSPPAPTKVIPHTHNWGLVVNVGRRSSQLTVPLTITLPGCLQSCRAA